MIDAAYGRALGIGAVAGLRCLTPPAATLLAADSVFAGPAMLAAAGELIGDKLPFTPSRTLPPALAARIVSGGLCGAAIAKRNEASPAGGALVGVVGAVAATYVGYWIRHALTKAWNLPDFAVALAEDSLAIWGARAVNASTR